LGGIREKESTTGFPRSLDSGAIAGNGLLFTRHNNHHHKFGPGDNNHVAKDERSGYHRAVR
jgi:hypothetical protein